jgi:hypothetical protein
MAIERLKSDLQIAASERQVRFARLHEKVAEVVAEVYSRLFRFTTAVDKYVAELELAGAPSKKELRIAVGDAMTNFTDYYKPHALYLPKTLANQTKAYSDKLFNCARDFKLGVEEGGDARSPNTDTWRRVATEMRKEAPALFLAIEDEFRKMLGVHNL